MVPVAEAQSGSEVVDKDTQVALANVQGIPIFMKSPIDYWLKTVPNSTNWHLILYDKAGSQRIISQHIIDHTCGS